MKLTNLLTNEINQNEYHFNKLTRNKIGILYIAPINMVPDDCLACDGYVLKISDYKKLYLAIGNYFNTGNEQSDEFRIPDYNITGRFLQPSQTPMEKIEAGLPNITGSFYLQEELAIGATGAFWISSNPGNNTSYRNKGPGGSPTFSFSASRISDIYGNSTTVQPPSQTIQVCIKYK